MDLNKAAVIVRGACKQYRGKNDGAVVLDNLDMTVTKGTIYGLLGPSGCGKTTLLSCVVGTRTLDAGDIIVFGENPASNSSKKLASRIGYMPQENALMTEFTVRESIYYFGWIYNMSNKELYDTYKLLEEILDLPSENKMIKNLSGGQLRRVSLAVTFIHSPKLLILDEPTVGMDPLLRQGIWDHLLNLTAKGTTVIVTTHYIEEARQADMIGLMRFGKLLIEGPPESVISRFNVSTLEEVFLLLSVRQSMVNRCATESDTSSQECHLRHLRSEWKKQWRDTQSSNENNNYTPHEISKPCKSLSSSSSPSFFNAKELSHRVTCMKALIYKNLMRQLRHPGSLCLALVIPILQTTFFALGIGHLPTDLNVAVVNKELGNFSNCFEYEKLYPVNVSLLNTGDCYYSRLSCLFIDYVQDSFTKKVYYPEMQPALNDFYSGKINAIIYMTENFTTALAERVENNQDADNSSIENSEIKIIIHNHNQVLSQSIKIKYIEYFQKFSEYIVKKCGRPIKVAHTPMNIHAPIYGTSHYSYNKFVYPAFLTSLTYFLTLSLTSIFLLLEKMEGLWDRTVVAGVSEIEILFSFIITQFLQMTLQIAIVLLMITFVYNYTISHNATLAILLIMAQGTSGMTFGFLASSFFDDLRNCTYFTLGTFIPYVILSGVVWPIQSMPLLLRFVSYASPGALSVESLRAILMKGWGISHPQVFWGFVSSIVYTIVQSACCLLLLKYKK